MLRILVAIFLGLSAFEASSQTIQGNTGLSVGSAPVNGTCTNGYTLYNNSGVLGCQVSGGVATNGGLLRGDYSTSRFYLPIGMLISSGLSTITQNNKIQCVPGSVGQLLTISNVGLSVTTLSVGGFAQIAVYASSGGLPGALLSSTGSGAGVGLSTTTAAFVSGALSSSIQVGPGSANGQNLWWCSNLDNATALLLPTAIVPGPQEALIGATSGTNLFNNSTVIASLSCTGANCNGGSSTFGTWPATLAGTTWTDSTSRTAAGIAFQPTSIP